ncbi:hypothetical protein [Komagataeibacter sp. FNDCF1]|uniref:hypothetical protein n=1 Tax=Komagataeibacter sp. FNDCF1 TaxID=2878681 RepID=UPI001E4ABF23|nr:hypothetical protein [Komagataeibacter sp. FNDCF1]MCE2563592.1 hypothetical protein [Komagataeibacter sp. FNDCF1]
MPACARDLARDRQRHPLVAATIAVRAEAENRHAPPAASPLHHHRAGMFLS